MFNSIKNCAKLVVQRNGKKLGNKKSKSSKKVLKTLPVFQYPISESSDRRVYVWGLAEHGALGTIDRVQKIDYISFIPKPSRLTFGEIFNVVDFACGYGFTAFAVRSNDNNIVYGSGINTDSQIGFHSTDKKYKHPIITTPRPVNLPLKEAKSHVVSLAAGRAHLLILTNEGLFTLGNNGYGQCGRPIINNENYRKNAIVHHIPDVKGNQITQVYAGQDHSILLTENGEVYCFGWGADGQTGLAHYQNEYMPSLVKGDLAGQRIVKVACVADCVLALSDKGKVFGWGNSEYGQIPGVGDNQQVNIATEIETCKDIGRIIDIASGGSFCMVLNDAGEVYVWGYGILGFGPEVRSSLKPTKIPSTLFGVNDYEPNIRVSKIYCGISHLAAVTNKGDLYMWGRNKFGSLGLGHVNDQFFPLKVSIGAEVKKVSCGVDHTVTLCKPFV
ncbi:RCC1-like G exchanging factor-like protein [Leptopilina boulardi]|uniref:RCC1-like G exchanging factor-like protein n=1 Tax=Leptopilina boulardi TaxID=63433 RepID=UPI0021F501CC|nr:RCC1-like G exchanging factor-like protein [Leptopilina boulardi]